MKLVQLKTCQEFQNYLWLNGALLSLNDLMLQEIDDHVLLSETNQSKEIQVNVFVECS